MTARAFAADALKHVAGLADRVRPAPPGISILIYHRVGGGTGSAVDLPVAEFERQVAWLGECRRVCSLDDAVGELCSGGGEPGVVLTFDDGTPDWVDHVLPVLERHAVPATFYVATEFVDTGEPFPSGPAISWAGLAELATSPLTTIGSHTHSHRLLDRVDGATAARELDRSLELLEDRLGVRATHFAYPKALLGSAAAEAEVRARFSSATVAGSRPNPFGLADLHRLTRSPVQTTDGWRWFQAKADGGLWLEDRVRQLVNQARYRGESS